MEKSLFYGWLQVAFGPLIMRFVETLNGVEGAEPQYLFTRYLGKQYSVDLKWGSVNSENSNVAADIVALDASVPLKIRDKFGTAEGEISKMGMKMRKSEREMHELQTMEAMNINGRLTDQIMTKLFNDPLRVTRGVYERLEYIFLEGLSTGYATVSENVNEGIAVRVSYGYNPNQISGAAVVWSDAAADPLVDIARIQEEARVKGRTVNYMLMGRTTMNNFRSKPSVKELYAARIGFYGDNNPTPDFEQTNATLANNKMPQIVLIERTVTVEKNGKRTTIDPWAANAVVFTDTLSFGDVHWSTLVEANNPKRDILYATVNDYILVSQWHTNDPFSETVSSQALAFPVIDDPQGKWVLNTETVQADQPVEDQPFQSLRIQSQDEDPNGGITNEKEGGVQSEKVISYNGSYYKPQQIVKALNEVGEGSKLKGNQKDETIVERVSALTPEGKSKFETFLFSNRKETEEGEKSKGKSAEKSKGKSESAKAKAKTEDKTEGETDSKATE